MSDTSPQLLPQENIADLIHRYIDMSSYNRTDEELSSHVKQEELSNHVKQEESSPSRLKLPVPECRVRCDSGNGSDIQLQNSGDVSPACSDYGGGRDQDETDQSDSDTLSRQHSHDSAVSGCSNCKRRQNSLKVTCPQPSISRTLLTPQSSIDLAAPMVKVWSAEHDGHSELSRKDSFHTVELFQRQFSLESNQTAPSSSIHGLCRRTSGVSISSMDSVMSGDNYFRKVQPVSLGPSQKMPSSPKGQLKSKLKGQLSDQTLLSPKLHKKVLNASASDSQLLVPSSGEVIDMSPQPTPDEIKWQALKDLVPFYNENIKKKWVQLAGHSGSFERGIGDRTILKKHTELEHAALVKIGSDPLHKYIPRFYGVTQKAGEKYIELENLLQGFDCPSIMDCKMGCRTYLECDFIKDRKNPKARKDLYEKMIELDSNEPTTEEHEAQAITKPRYMQWRERISSTSTLSFRVEGIKWTDSACCSEVLKKARTHDELLSIFKMFTRCKLSTLKLYQKRLYELRDTLNKSPFFETHEMIGSSLLFIHDQDKASVWVIDFGKTNPLPKGLPVTHDASWELGNHEDGYLIGLNNIITLLEKLISELDQSENSKLTS